MIVIPNTNQRYLTSNGTSVYSLKQNVNQFLSDFAKLEQKNRIKNGYLNVIDNITTYPTNWICSNISTFSFNKLTNSSFVNISPGGSLTQLINFIKPNEEYTAIVFASSPSANTIQLRVYNEIISQIFNVNDSLEINQASTIVSTSSSVTKNIVQFKTNSTAVSGTFLLEVKNISANTQQIEIEKILVYKGLIEIDDVLDISMSISDEVIARSLILSDSFTDKSFEFFIYNDDIINYEIEIPLNEKVFEIFINDSIYGINISYRLYVIDGVLTYDVLTYNSIYSSLINIKDIINGINYDIKIENGVINFHIREYTPSTNVFVDQSESGEYFESKYSIQVNGSLLDFVIIDELCVPAASGGYYIRDKITQTCYLVNIKFGILRLTEVAFDYTFPFFKLVKDLELNINYKLFISDGILMTITI